MSKKKQPTARTLEECRRLGWYAGVVERNNPKTFNKHDLFGFIDVVAMTDGELLAIQATSGSNVSDRVRKIRTERREEALRWLGCGGRIEVWGWKFYQRKVDRKNWRVRRVEITESDLTEQDNES